MVNFKELRAAKDKPVVTDPIEIFRRLPPPKGFFDLSPAQKEILDIWYKRRNERDLVIKMHTGGGKTLVGLLIAQSILNETHEPVVYLSPTVQLVNQTLNKAKEYSIPAVAYEKGSYFPPEFLKGKSVLICTYQALFNGLSRFGAPGSQREMLNVQGLILDDAHVAFSTVRDSFTLNVEKSKDEEAYRTLTNMFRDDFIQLGKQGTFDDVASGIDYNILEVPYWSWQLKASVVHQCLREKKDNHLFVWPLLRDFFNYCHVFISKDSFTITPIYPLVDLIPTFLNCPRRVFMSATIRDDSEIIRTFDADRQSISDPIMSVSLAGISEKMILVPELLPLAVNPKFPQQIAKWIAENKKISISVLVPSDFAAKSWQDVAEFAESSEKVEEYVKQLQEGHAHGPFIFSNRYDGIDLPGDACRLLIMSELPRGASSYEQYRNNIFLGGDSLNSTLAQRIEQGMGRAARGPGDYCVILLTGKDLTSWISRRTNLNFLTSSTRAQLQMGVEISKNVDDPKGLLETMFSCFDRDRGWIEYHAETLAESIESETIDNLALECASLERKVFQLWRDGYIDKAIAKLERFTQETEGVDFHTKGWLWQFAARIAYFSERQEKAEEFQGHAYACNKNLMRPKLKFSYAPLVTPGRQAEEIANRIDSYSPKRGFLAYFDEVVSHLVPEASANQFEQALQDLGSILGFTAERPEKSYNVGPDVIWLLNDSLGLVIEAKSRKKEKNPLTKQEHGQLLVSTEWFEKEYPNHRCVSVVVQASDRATDSAVAENTKVFTHTKLNELIAVSRKLFEELVMSLGSSEEMASLCEKRLVPSRLTPEKLVNYYLDSFKTEA